MNDLISEWIVFCSSQALSPAHHMSGVQKIRTNVSWTISGESLFEGSTNISDFGYSDKGNKLRALKKHYFNKERTVAAKKLLIERVNKKRYGSCQFPLTGDEKLWTKQDWCMSSASVTHYPNFILNTDTKGPILKVTVNYRTTEVIKKFGADLIFLREVVLPRFNRVLSIYDITFMFANLTVHPMFFVTLLAHHPYPIDFLNEIKVEDPRFFQGIVKWCVKYLLEGDTSWVQKFSQARQTHGAMERLMKPRRLKSLRSYFREEMEKQDGNSI